MVIARIVAHERLNTECYTRRTMFHAVTNSLHLSKTHYENFPVASVLMPRRLREPVALIYAFARQADDFADEDDIDAHTRIALLNGYRQQLDHIAAQQPCQDAFFDALAASLQQHQLPLAPLYDLLDAFTQDVTKTRYQHFDELLDYCRRSANPVGRLMLHLYDAATPENIAHSDNICSALQIINFLQDIAIDYQKNRIYLPQDELRQFGISEADIANGNTNAAWWQMMQFQIQRARQMLANGKPLGRILQGRIGLEMRLIIAGGETILDRLQQGRGDVFNHRPVLRSWDWINMLFKAFTR
jgi:squalene synthase HpnC